MSASELEAKAKKSAARSKLEGTRPRFETIKTATTDEDGKGLKAGLWWLGLDKDGQTKINHWLSSPIEATAKTCGEDGTNHGLALSFAVDGVWRDWVMPKHLLGDARHGWLKVLLDRGVKFNRKHLGHFEDWLHTVNPQEKKTATNRTGWTEDRRSFVLTNETLGNQETVFQSEGSHAAPMKKKGTLKEWKEHIAAKCSGNPLLMAAVSAALAGPTMRLVHLGYGGVIFHYNGPSSTGKSTGGGVAASVYGGPDYVSSWRSTDNGLEGIASNRNDALLVLDEISQCDPKRAGSIAYMLGNGQGKQRMTADVLTREPMRWRLVAISNGEHSLESEMRRAGGRVNAGQEVRMLNIPVLGRYGVFDNLHEFKNGAKLADHLKLACGQYYGTAGPEFIHALLNKTAKDSGSVADLYRKTKERPEFDSEDGLERRAGDWFALVATAGELAIQVSIVPWNEGDPTKAAAHCFKLWKEERGGGSTETRQILNSVRAFIDAYGDSRFTPADADYSAKDSKRAGWYQEHEPCPFLDMDKESANAARVWLFTSEALREAGSGFDLQTVARVLDDAGWIAKKDGSRLQSVAWIGQPPRQKQQAKRLYWVVIPDED